MRPRPNPTQHTVADEREWRQLVRLYAPPGKAIDKDDLVRAFELGSQDSRANAVKRAALDWVRENMPERFIVRPGFAAELRAYAEGTGELPDDAQALDGEDQLARRFKGASAPGVVAIGVGNRVMVGETDREKMQEQIAARAHEGKPDEEGRFPGQEPRGRFARAGDPLFEPDSR